MNGITLIRMKNRALGMVMPEKVVRDNARLFLSPRTFPLKEWEKEAEQQGTRFGFGDGLSAIRWGSGERKILLMHGWESRATQMYGLASALAADGCQVIAIDAPLHGRSKGKRTSPVAFAQAIVAADRELGPFDGAVGHSMGAVALAIAREAGANLGRYALVSSPACLYDTLIAFCNFMGLSTGCTKRFVRHVEREVGRSARDLDVARLMAGHTPAPLLVHARNDREIPYEAVATIKRTLSGATVWSANDLGHRKIVRDPTIASVVQQFVTTGIVSEQEVATAK
ncbi:alpha/beta fold hydrolase [Marinobacter sp. SS5-14b]|uniref:alpha/beta fold hydrolase n=1 Tax=Marinobacter sp. SS5-14b TaxID=3050456 RepID=UPI0026E0508A|nr:alpha/beta hydrolase [Marinobacter sp. SS5-14b]